MTVVIHPPTPHIVGYRLMVVWTLVSPCSRERSDSKSPLFSEAVLDTLCHTNLYSFFGPQIRRGYPPNLSISFSGGKETKEDSPSNGERTGISPAPNRVSHDASGCGVWERHFLGSSRCPSPLERGPFP